MEHKLTKVDIVYNYLLRRIISGQYADGQRIVISSVAEQCQMSDIPVREALRRLESDGYVRFNANHGAIAVGISKNSLLRTFEIKGVLEGYAARQCLDYLSPYKFNVLRELNEQMNVAASYEDSSKFAELNTQFHMFMYENAPNPELLELIRVLNKKWNMTRSVFNVSPSRMHESYLEHLEILRLAQALDFDGIETFVRQHKANAAQSFLEPANE